jgi:hypothetical protein
MTRQDILSQALAARLDEVLHYQINIDNFTLAIAHIESLPSGEQAEMSDFRQQLAARLAAEQHEHKKAKIMLAVIQQQVEA